MRTKPLIALTLAALALPGCIERRIHITSNPTGASVILNDVQVGKTPVEIDFTFFGTYDVQLRKPGFEPLLTSATTKAPLHEQPGIDLVAHALPHRFTTDIRWHFNLEPAKDNKQELIARARELRTKLGADPTNTATETPVGNPIDINTGPPKEEPLEPDLPPLLPEPIPTNPR